MGVKGGESRVIDCTGQDKQANSPGPQGPSPLPVITSESLPATPFSASANGTANCPCFPWDLKGIPEKFFFHFGRGSLKTRESLLENSVLFLGTFPEMDPS